MLDLSPTKLLIIFVVVVVLLGPKRLPEVARQLGAGWRKLREFHGQIDRELRKTVPDLPSSQDIVRFARSPITLLNQLAERPDQATESLGSSSSSTDDFDGIGGLDAERTVLGGDGAPFAGNGRTRKSNGDGRPALTAPVWSGLDPDDPNLN